ncbi:uncharacterized protein RSE6_05478 [Rhynchosporium secalis]|uniref:Uncharacterized protein n=1 Tax=Rhynchosporium secalis TaxID=38038 RepID=A0A1E1M7W4_RHYSE|nr:uncharacterized protein RSE6_05478 [Rhynchosporium secalis]
MPGQLCPARLTELTKSQIDLQCELDFHNGQQSQAHANLEKYVHEVEVNLHLQLKEHQAQQSMACEAYREKEQSLTIQRITCTSYLGTLEVSLQQQRAIHASPEVITGFQDKIQKEQDRKIRLKEQEQSLIVSRVGALEAEDVAWKKLYEQAAQLTRVLVRDATSRYEREITPMRRRALEIQRELEILKSRINDDYLWFEESDVNNRAQHLARREEQGFRVEK